MKRNLAFLLISNTLLLVCALYLLPFVRFSSKSVGLDFLVILGWSALVLGASWAEMNVILPKPDATDTNVVRGRRLNLGRSLFLVVAIVMNFGWTDRAAGGFWFSYYSKFGVYTTAMRSNDHKKAVWAMKRSSLIINPGLAQGLLPQVARLTASKDSVVKGTAFAWLGYSTRQMNLINATNVDVETKKQASQVKKILLDNLSGVFNCLRLERRPKALEGCIYAAGWVSKPDFLGPLNDVIARSKDPGVLVAAAQACQNIGGVRALHMLAGMVADTKGLPRQAAVIGYLNAAFVLVDMKSPVINTPAFTLAEQKLAKQVPGLPKPALCAFLQHFPELADARFSKAIAQVLMLAGKPSNCPDVEVLPPIGIPVSMSLHRDFDDCLTRAISCIAKNNAILMAAMKKRISKGGNPRLVRLLKGILNAAGK